MMKRHELGLVVKALDMFDRISYCPLDLHILEEEGSSEWLQPT